MQVSIEDIDSDALVRSTAAANKAYRPGPKAVERTRKAAFDLVNTAYSQNLVRNGGLSDNRPVCGNAPLHRVPGLPAQQRACCVGCMI